MDLSDVHPDLGSKNANIPADDSSRAVHDIKGRLTAVKMGLQVLERYPDRADLRRKFIKECLESVEAMESTLKYLSDFIRSKR